MRDLGIHLFTGPTVCPDISPGPQGECFVNVWLTKQGPRYGFWWLSREEAADETVPPNYRIHVIPRMSS